MPRKPRFFVPGIPGHAIQRGNNRQAVFFENEDYRVYLGWLKLAAEKYRCDIHAYVLMTNHVHLLVTPARRDSISGLFQYVGRHYVAYVNHTYGRTGTLWEGRYKASLIEEERYLLTCYRYIELNPVRAGIVSSPEQYDWSSYCFNALGKVNPLLSPHPLYYRLDAAQLYEVRAATQSGTPLGNDGFRAEIERVLQFKIGQTHRGRPVKR
jgi:putative transposase